MRKADNLPPSCAVVTKYGSLNFLEPSGHPRACNGTDLPLYVSVLPEDGTDVPKYVGELKDCTDVFVICALVWLYK